MQTWTDFANSQENERYGSMKAWVLHDINDIRYEDTRIPTLKSGEVLVRVMAAGICGSDIPRIYENGAHRMPLIPGHEFSGAVETVGPDASKEWSGKRVGVFPLIPCNKCAPCRSRHPEMCRDYDYIGSRRDGAFAEFVAVPESNLIELPDNVSFEEAAMLEPMAVAVHAMRKGTGEVSSQHEDNSPHEKNSPGEDDASLEKDAKILVFGLGTIGLLLTMFLKERGYSNIFVAGNKEPQKEKAKALCIPEDHYIDSRSQDVISFIKEKGGADVFFECVGRNECVSSGIDCAAPGGKIVLVGNPYTDMTLPRDTYWKILRDQLRIEGTWNSTFLPRNSGKESSDDWSYVIKRLGDGRIRPSDLITQKFPIEELEEGFHIMRDKTEYYCKVIMDADQSMI